MQWVSNIYRYQRSNHSQLNEVGDLGYVTFPDCELLQVDFAKWDATRLRHVGGRVFGSSRTKSHDTHEPMDDVERSNGCDDNNNVRLATFSARNEGELSQSVLKAAAYFMDFSRMFILTLSHGVPQSKQV